MEGREPGGGGEEGAGVTDNPSRPDTREGSPSPACVGEGQEGDGNSQDEGEGGERSRRRQKMGPKMTRGNTLTDGQRQYSSAVWKDIRRLEVKGRDFLGLPANTRCTHVCVRRLQSADAEQELYCNTPLVLSRKDSTGKGKQVCSQARTHTLH
jgi:hypothetical protein